MNESANNSTAQARLYERLIDIYDWRGVKRLAFALGTPYSFFALPNKEELARRLIEYLTDQNRLGCLVRQMRQTDPYPLPETAEFGNLPCEPVIRVQAVFPAERYFSSAPDYQAELAAVFSLEKEDVVITAVAADTVRLLIALPPATQFLDFLTILQKLNEKAGLKLVSLALFETLSSTVRQTWQLIAGDYPPRIEDGVLRPVITWPQAWQTIQRQPPDQTPSGAAATPDAAPPQVHLGESSRPGGSPIPPASPTSVWYQIIARPDNDFLPQYQTGDCLLAQTDLGVVDFRLRRGQPILVMLNQPIADTIQAEPYDGLMPEPITLYAGYSTAEIEFVRTDAVISVRLTPDSEPERVPEKQIKGIVVGVWRQPDI